MNDILTANDAGEKNENQTREKGTLADNTNGVIHFDVINWKSTATFANKKDLEKALDVFFVALSVNCAFRQ